MRRVLVLTAVCLFAFSVLGCAGFVMAPVVPPPGMAVTITSAPLSTNFNPGTAVAPRRGKASCTNVLGIVSFGNAGIHEAATSGGLTRIHYADYDFMNVLGVLSVYTTVVYGE